MKAAETIIAWNASTDGTDVTECHSERMAPPGSVAVGPVLIDEGGPYWTTPYYSTAGAAYAMRRKIFGLPQQMHVLRDWYMLVYSYGIHPYVAHRAFLLIDEYQTIIKRMGFGPAPGEPGHDPYAGYGRAIELPVPSLQIRRTGRATHFWPQAQGGDDEDD
jgi:hypothetical protein